jgi:outer membrane protein insertion porin family
LAAALLTGRAPADEVLPPAAGVREALPPPSSPPPTPKAATGAEEELVAEVRIQGNQTVPEIQIVSNITTRAGRPFDRSVVQRDVRRLANLGWFVDVKPLYEQTSKGTVVIFRVVERPTIRYVQYLGNEHVSDKKLGKETGLKAGGSVDPYAVEEGRRKIREYYAGRGYNNIQVTILEGAKPTDQGVCYLINEGVRQRISKVTFIGNDFVGASRLKTQIKSKPPILRLFKGYLDRERIEADVEALTAYYRSYGYFKARIGRKLTPNEEGDWTELTFVVNEGPRYQVRNVSFMGNSKFEPHAMVEAAKLAGGSPFEQAKMERDALWVQKLYGSHGFVFADVKPETVFLEDPGQVDVVYHIDEGRRWRVGRIFVHIGGDNPHTRIQTALNRCTLRPGQIMDIRELDSSERRLMASSLFNTDPSSGERPKITYEIPEDSDFGVADRDGLRPSKIRGQSPIALAPPVLPPPASLPVSTSARTPAYPLLGGECVPPADSEGADLHVYCENEEHYRRWLEAENQAKPIAELDEPADGSPWSVPSNGLDPTATPSIPPQLDERPSGDLATPPAGTRPVDRTASDYAVIRGQSPDDSLVGGASQWRPVRPLGPYVAAKPPAGSPYQDIEIRGQSPGGLPQQGQPVQQAYAAVEPNGVGPAPVAGQIAYGGQVVRATGPESGGGTVLDGSVQPTQYSPNTQPPAGSVWPQPLNTQGPLPGYSVDPTSPLYASPALPTYPEGTVDIFIRGDETQTGRLMIGAGVNSNAGVVGNISIDERNFDWTRYPTSWEDFRNGSAFRGAGQRFRIDASPGSQVSRYLVSWQEPYLLDRPIALGLSGSYYTRRFRDWDEQRTGGRVSLGYQWVDRDLTLSGAYRGEDVLVSRPSVLPGIVPALDEVQGHNALHGFGLTLVNDTRDSAFLPTQGHYFQIGGEQVIGTFDYPRVDVDFRKYFLITERPDHSGRHVVSGATTVGYTGTHTPIYDHFFAGGFDTLRGFDFRGASPVVNNVQVGGEFMWINSVQYLFPITADDMLHGVVFSDFGTVEQKVEIKDFRVAVGTGLRITVPAMGPAPIALDFAWAVNHADFDDRQVFSFSLGFTR